MKGLTVGANLLGLYQLELHASTSPGDEVAVGRVVQQRDQELPELQGAAALVRWPVTVHRGLLLEFTCEGSDVERLDFVKWNSWVKLFKVLVGVFSLTF